jgi:hypothetical protein
MIILNMNYCLVIYASDRPDNNIWRENSGEISSYTITVKITLWWTETSCGLGSTGTDVLTYPKIVFCSKRGSQQETITDLRFPKRDEQCL